jgi:hypothetical protein
VHEYATAAAEQMHEPAPIITAEVVAFCDAYHDWIVRGFSSTRPGS